MIRIVLYVLTVAVLVYLSMHAYALHSAHRAINQTPPERQIGPANADLLVTQFFDYGCEPCRRIHPVFLQAVRRDGRVRYTPRPMATQDINTSYAATTLYAAEQQGKFSEMHNALMTNYRALSDEAIEQLTIQVGAEWEIMREDLGDPQTVQDALANKQIFYNLGGGPVPAFLIGDSIMYSPGPNAMPDVDTFLRLFDEARARQ